MSAKKFRVGQVLFRAATDRRQSGYYDGTMVVTKIGSKWVYAKRPGWTCQEVRFDPETMAEDGGGYSSHATYWISQQDYEDAVALNGKWDELRRRFDYGSGFRNRPAHVGVAEIDAILAILQGPKA